MFIVYSIIIFIWFCLFLFILLNNNCNINKEDYFPSIINSYKNSKLRFFWKTSYLVFTYTIGLIALAFFKSAEYPVIGLKRLTKFIFFSKD